jgi:hypothetical protein
MSLKTGPHDGMRGSVHLRALNEAASASLRDFLRHHFERRGRLFSTGKSAMGAECKKNLSEQMANEPEA